MKPSPDHWFRVGDSVIVSGAGVGKITEVGNCSWGEKDGPEGYRYYRVNFGPTECPTCHRPSGDRLEWAMAIHISLTVSERKRREAEHASV